MEAIAFAGWGSPIGLGFLFIGFGFFSAGGGMGSSSGVSIGLGDQRSSSLIRSQFRLDNTRVDRSRAMSCWR